MLTKRIIACLDVDGGRVVKGVQFENLRDAGDPAELAKAHSEAGADEVVLLDISAVHERRPTLLDTVRRAARQLFIPFTVGGGIRTLEDASAVFSAGADKISINSAALHDPTLITQIAARFGSQAVVVAIDAQRSVDGSHWQAFSHGGREGTARDAIGWAQEAESRGAGEIDASRGRFGSDSRDCFRRRGRRATFCGSIPRRPRRCRIGGIHFSLRFQPAF